MAKSFLPLFRFAEGWIPKSQHPRTEEERRNVILVYYFMLLILFACVTLGGIRFLRGDRIIPGTMAVNAFLVLATPWIHHRFRSIRAAASWLAGLETLQLAGMGIFGGGLFATSCLWYGALAVFILITLGIRVARFWVLGIALYTVTLWQLQRHGVHLPNLEDPRRLPLTWAIAIPAGLLLIISMLNGFFRAHEIALENLSRQKNILAIKTEEILKANAKAEEALRSRSDFIATISHEIRTPMNGILGAAQLIKETDLTEEQLRLLEAVLVSGEGLLAILGDILDFSKIEAGKLELRIEPFPLRSTCENCIAVFSAVAQSKGLSLSLSVADVLPATVSGDKARLRQVLLNLLGNAVKFTEQGNVRLMVESLQDKPNWVRFAVEDEGIGMSPETLKILFHPYRQADSSSSRKYGGTGLGLAISRRLVGLMGGEIQAHNREGKGSKFIFEIPLPLVETPPEPVPVHHPGGEKVRFSGRRILLVEDNSVNRMVAGKILEKLGVTVAFAIDGSQAVEQWRTGSFDLVLMDCQMPGMDGYEATRHIRALEQADPSRRRIPILALTAHAMEEDRERCLSAGMDEYLTKPVKSESLRQALQTWLGGTA